MNIKSIWKKAFGVDFKVDEFTLDEFAKWNQTQWNKTGKKENGYCYINYIMITKELSLMLPKILYAKAVEETQEIVPIILDWGTDKSLTKLYNSFGIGSINIHKEMVKNISGIFKSLGIMYLYKMKKKTGMDLQQLEIDGVQVGKNIYGDILRSSGLSTIREVKDKVCIRKIFTLCLFADTVDKITRKYPPKVCISDDWAYNEGIVLEYVNKAGAYISQINLRRENTLTIGKGKFQRYRHAEMGTQIRKYIENGNPINQKVVDEYLVKRFEGKNCSFRDKVAFQGKKNLSREEWNLSMGLEPNKKNVVVMCHTFSDAVFNSEYSAFRDYYDWTEQTLKIISTLDNVNWIVKPHPARANYNESTDSIEDMLERYKAPNVHVFPDDVSTASLKDVADTLVTLCGTSGLEFPCFGIPVVVCGKAMYTGFGFTEEPDTIEEYREILANIQNVKKLDQNQIDMARSVLYSYIRCFDTPLDEWDDMLYKQLHMMEDKNILPQDVNKEMSMYNSRVLKEIMDFTKLHDWKESEYYKRGERLSKKYTNSFLG